MSALLLLLLPVVPGIFIGWTLRELVTARQEVREAERENRRLTDAVQRVRGAE